MKKTISLSLACVCTVFGADVNMQDITIVDEKPTALTLKNISSQEVKSADLAEALSKNSPSISLIRRSGIANDILLRGQKRDNINILVDGTKIYGACPNRMDPPTSHVVSHVVQNVIINEGPFDVEEFGTLSGSVKVETRKPTQELQGEVGVNVGNYSYKKALATISGGNEKVKALLSISKETGGQYEDGDGNDFAQQLANYTASTTSTADDPFKYSNLYAGMDAFKKLSILGKVFIDITDDQELRLGITANRSDNILYPSSKMDAVVDDSNIYNLEYIFKNLASYSDKFSVQIYKSDVEHPMSTQYRIAGATSFSINELTTDMMGLKIKNSFKLDDAIISYGLDLSRRNWDGVYTKTSVATGAVTYIGNSIDDVDTDNIGFFAKTQKSYGAFDINFGARYDHSKVDTSAGERDRTYNALDANVFATYRVTEDLKYFVGVGKSSRIPDARELYNIKYPNPTTRVLVGNPDLDQTKNYEIDAGFEKQFENGKVKLTTFYSMLKDYIYSAATFENIDATIYGAELSSTYMLNDALFMDAGIAYKRGKKDSLPTAQSDTDLADIPPLQFNANINYSYDAKGDLQLSFIAANKWKSIDSDNGEQELAGYGIFNFKTTRKLGKGFEITAGIDNIFDKTYAISNTYRDLTLITDGISETMLIHEPGRYAYINASYKF
ncbi:MAG: TonB-dependent receptor [Sulfurospirillum sp.]|nr:TonB-dependent receptor [Sulfurospirillum sp.]